MAMARHRTIGNGKMGSGSEQIDEWILLGTKQFIEQLLSRSVPLFGTTFSSPSRWEGLIYTVICRDGRHFVFQNLSEIGELAELIDVHVARAKQS
jgi:hypothetical protein